MHGRPGSSNTCTSRVPRHACMQQLICHTPQDGCAETAGCVSPDAAAGARVPKYSFAGDAAPKMSRYNSAVDLARVPSAADLARVPDVDMDDNVRCVGVLQGCRVAVVAGCGVVWSAGRAGAACANSSAAGALGRRMCACFPGDVAAGETAHLQRASAAAAAASAEKAHTDTQTHTGPSCSSSGQAYTHVP